MLAPAGFYMNVDVRATQEQLPSEYSDMPNNLFACFCFSVIRHLTYIESNEYIWKQLK